MFVAIVAFTFLEARHLVVLPTWYQADPSVRDGLLIPRREDGALMVESLPNVDPDDEKKIVYPAQLCSDIRETVICIHRCEYQKSSDARCRFLCPHQNEVDVYIKPIGAAPKSGKTWDCSSSGNCNVNNKYPRFTLSKKCNVLENNKFAVYDKAAGFKAALSYCTLSQIPH
jgi:hypothetical protein